MKSLRMFLLLLISLSAVLHPQTPATGQTVILISFDGFRPDYMDRGITPNLSALAANGVRAAGMKPVFPTKTFVNHYTIATGLYPSNSGIISNTMYDKETDAWFRISDAAAVGASVWWKGEPIWATAVKQGKRSACYFWVGSEAEVAGVRPTYWNKYDGSIPNAERVRTVLGWLDLPASERPSIITLYFSDTDNAGHRYGPDAPELNTAVAGVDSILGLLLEGLRTRRLSEAVNLIVVSDHGMAQLDAERVLYWDEVQDPSTVTVVEQGPVLTLNAPTDSVGVIADRLRGLGDHITVLSDADLKARYHMDRTPRVPDIFAVADEGWMILQRRTMRRPVSGGTHGYDNDAPSMQATFVAHGPAFKESFTIDAVHAVDVYGLMAHILGLDPAPNDGSMERIGPVLRVQ